MMIFIHSLPDTTSQIVLHRLVSARLESGSSDSAGNRPLCDILRIKDLESNGIEYHGLVYFDGDREHQRLLDSLGQIQIDGHMHHGRLFSRRVNQDDRRIARSVWPVESERRLSDRRRDRLLIEPIYGSLNGYLGHPGSSRRRSLGL